MTSSEGAEPARATRPSPEDLVATIAEIAATATGTGMLQPGAAYALGALAEVCKVQPNALVADIAHALLGEPQSPDEVSTALDEAREFMNTLDLDALTAEQASGLGSDAWAPGAAPAPGEDPDPDEGPYQLEWKPGMRVEFLDHVDDHSGEVWATGRVTHVGPTNASQAGPVFLPAIDEFRVRVLSDRTESSPGFTVQVPKSDPLAIRPLACSGGCGCHWREDAERFECGCAGACSGLGGGSDGQSPDPEWEARPDPADAWHRR